MIQNLYAKQSKDNTYTMRVELKDNVTALDVDYMINELMHHKRSLDINYYNMIQQYLHGVHIDNAKIDDISKSIEDVETLRNKIINLVKPTHSHYVTDPEILDAFYKICKIARKENHAKRRAVPVVTTKPVVVEKEIKKVARKRTTKLEPKKEKKESKKDTKPVHLSPEKVEKVMKANKQLLKDLFKFSSVDECASNKRSMEYYMSKQDILDIIEDNPDIKRTMPPKYKTMKKEDLCKVLVDKN